MGECCIFSRAPVLALALVLAGAWPGSTTGAPDAPRRVQLENLVRHDCGSCHGMRLTGGLGPALTVDALAMKPRALLLHTVLEGRAGTPMAPWKRFLTPDEAAWIVDRLIAGTLR